MKTYTGGVERGDGVAKYERIAADLRGKIQAGEYLPGDRLPVEQALREAYGVSLPVVRQALDALEAEGLVDRVHGRGTYVRTPRQRQRRTNEMYQREKDRVRQSESERRKNGAGEESTGLSREDLEFSTIYAQVEANEDLSRVFGVSVGTPLLRRDYRTYKRGTRVPFSLNTSHMIYEMVAVNPDLLLAENEPWPGGTQHQLSTIGVEVDHIIDTVTARPPSAQEMEELDIKPGVAVLVIRKVTYDTTGRAVEVADIITPGNLTELVFKTSLKRWNL